MLFNSSISKVSSIEIVFQSQQETSYLWRTSSAEDRIVRLKKIRAWIKDHQQDIRNALKNDFSKPEPETDLSEIYPVTSEINHAIKNLKKWMNPKSVSTPLPMMGTSGKIYVEPKGRSLIISPWNYPFNLTVVPLISALSAGCTAIIKPSEITPHTSELISKMISKLFDPSEVAVILGEVEVSTALLKLPFDHIFFTGSPAVGKIVMKAAAANLTSVTLELGGKSPAIVDEDADCKDAAEKLIWGKYVNCGQTCVAPDYMLVHDNQLATLLLEMKVALQKMYDTDFKGIENSPDMARIVNDKHFNRLTATIEDAVEKGAEIVFGGKVDPQNRYIEPTILTNVTDEMLVMQEEIFGPIFPIVTYSTLEKAIAYVNSKPKPLALYYFGSNSKQSSKVLQETSSGNAVINDCVLHFLHLELPFGGVNTSGIGKAHGYHGFLAFSNEKGVLKQRVGLNNVTLLRPPYGIKAKQIIASLIKWF
ncbi:aldehyde dehydrogenase family protein [Algoriphagus sp. D3-2-R+10]|uniref:aldehyde dehydrogenase family protein n=1 Tax=Algoriphagus aurantiacus TaxID=3103948 RepID=UPI002B364D7B|nr:aldehyde dehydrogenase family protein [Algoriphagus sp. D3-2-R+10]MEB2773688.1 aldehyde dehydrogenase family protein [Algoriphagus sp. D3-2-R+10]